MAEGKSQIDVMDWSYTEMELMVAKQGGTQTKQLTVMENQTVAEDSLDDILQC